MTTHIQDADTTETETEPHVCARLRMYLCVCMRQLWVNNPLSTLCVLGEQVSQYVPIFKCSAAVILILILFIWNFTAAAIRLTVIPVREANSSTEKRPILQPEQWPSSRSLCTAARRRRSTCWRCRRNPKVCSLYYTFLSRRWRRLIAHDKRTKDTIGHYHPTLLKRTTNKTSKPVVSHLYRVHATKVIAN